MTGTCYNLTVDRFNLTGNSFRTFLSRQLFYNSFFLELFIPLNMPDKRMSIDYEIHFIYSLNSGNTCSWMLKFSSRSRLRRTRTVRRSVDVLKVVDGKMGDSK